MKLLTAEAVEPDSLLAASLAFSTASSAASFAFSVNGSLEVAISFNWPMTEGQLKRWRGRMKGQGGVNSLFKFLVEGLIDGKGIGSVLRKSEGKLIGWTSMVFRLTGEGYP